MGRLSFGRVLDSLCLSNGSSSCFCTNSLENQDEYFETKPLVASEGGHLLRLKDILAEPQTLAFQLKPKVRLLPLFSSSSSSFFSFAKQEGRDHDR